MVSKQPSVELALKFAFSWHTEKFFLACLVLLLFYGLLTSLAGSLGVGALFYSIVIGILGYANYLKMAYRQEPIYPDDLKMITQFDLLHTMIGTGPFVLAMLCVILAVGQLSGVFIAAVNCQKETDPQRADNARLYSWFSLCFAF